jgi:hypothetical protein
MLKWWLAMFVWDRFRMIKITIFEVTKRPTYELVTVAGGDRPIYIGSTEWRVRQQAAIPNRIVHRKSRFAGMGPPH